MRADYAFKSSVLETLTVGVADVGTPTVTHNGFDRTMTKKDTDATSPVSIVSSQELTGTQTLDLTALATANGTHDCTGKKLRSIRVSNPSTNTGKLTVAPGAANAYPLFGTTMTVDVQLDGELALWFGDGLAAVSGTVKNLTFTPNNSGDTYKVQLVLG